jgi:hypothetical protein
MFLFFNLDVPGSIQGSDTGIVQALEKADICTAAGQAVNKVRPRQPVQRQRGNLEYADAHQGDQAAQGLLEIVVPRRKANEPISARTTGP